MQCKWGFSNFCNSRCHNSLLYICLSVVYLPYISQPTIYICLSVVYLPYISQPTIYLPVCTSTIYLTAYYIYLPVCCISDIYLTAYYISVCLLYICHISLVYCGCRQCRILAAIQTLRRGRGERGEGPPAALGGLSPPSPHLLSSYPYDTLSWLSFSIYCLSRMV